MSEYVFKLPDLGEGTVEAEIGEWMVNVGDDIAVDAVVGTMMTDKAAVEVSAPVAGRVLSLAGEPGDMIAVGSPLVVFETTEGVAAPAGNSSPAPAAPAANGGGAPATAVAPPPEPAADAPQPKPASRVVTSPAVRRRAKEAGIDLSRVPGSGPGGRISRRDFDAYVRRSSGDGDTPATVANTEVKIIGLRRMIAERMSTAKREIPHFSYVEEIDITELESLRQHLNGRQPDRPRLTVLPFITLALVRALREFPQCNATHDKERNVIVRHGGVHVGVATQTPDGLKVPVVRHAERRSLEDLAAEIRRVSDAAKSNTARRDELSGSSITITSLGKLGGIVTTPVVNMPEVAIIGVNRAVKRPVIVDDRVVARLMMNLSSSFDHRFVDGYDAAAMIQRIKEMLEQPATIFI